MLFMHIRDGVLEDPRGQLTMSLVLGFKSLHGLGLGLSVLDLALASDCQYLALEIVLDIGLEHSNFLATNPDPLPFSQVSRST